MRGGTLPMPVSFLTLMHNNQQHDGLLKRCRNAETRHTPMSISFPKVPKLQACARSNHIQPCSPSVDFG
jgi:hypothetical protein